MACCRKRSKTVGMLRCLLSPFALGMSLRRRNAGLYSPLSNCFLIFGQRDFRKLRSSFVFMLSLPAAPLFCSTCLSAVTRLFRSNIFSHMLSLVHLQSGNILSTILDTFFLKNCRGEASALRIRFGGFTACLIRKYPYCSGKFCLHSLPSNIQRIMSFLMFGPSPDVTSGD